MNGCIRHSIPAGRTRIGYWSLLGACCVLAGVVNSAPAQTSEPANAATWYQKAIERLHALTDAQREMLFNVDASNGMANTPPEYREMIVQMRPMLDLVRRGSMQQYSDFGLDHSQGFDLMLPHLREMRNLARLLNADVRLRLETGDSTGAAESLATMYRMSDHMSDDRVVISSMVGQSINSLANQRLQEALDAGKFNAAEAMTLLKASMRMSPSDPFHYADAVMTEQELVVTTIENKVMADDANANVEDLADIGQVPLELLGMDKEGLRVDVGQLDMLMDHVVEAFLDPDREHGQTEIGELMKEVEKGDHGFFAQLMMPAMDNVYKRMVDSEEALETRINELQKIASGEVTPGEAANAALWYLRGIELMEKLSPEQRERYRAIAAAPLNHVSDEVATELTNALSVIGLFIDGSAMKRCDFTFARADSHARLKRDYVPQMRDAVRLIQADAVRLVQQGKLDVAADRLAVCFRMAAHLSADKSILSSLNADSMFADTAVMYKAILAPTVTTEQKAMLFNAVERMSRKDPFGYIAASLSDRELAASWLHEYGATEPQNEGDLEPSPNKLARQWDADQLLSKLVLLDWLLEPHAEPDTGIPSLDFTLMGDVVALDKINAVRATARKLYNAEQTAHAEAPREERNRAVAVAAMRAIVPAVAPAKAHMAAARQTLRDIYRTLQPAEAKANESGDSTPAEEPSKHDAAPANE